MAIVNGYCTEAQLRGQFGDDVPQNLAQATLERAIEAASRAVDRYCHRKFWLDAAPSVRVYRVGHSRRAWIDDIGDTAGLVVKTDPGGDQSYTTTWASTDYQLSPLNQDVVASGDTVTPWAFWSMEAIGNYTFPTDFFKPTLQVTARFGWSAVPDDVEEATILRAAALFKRKDAPFGVAGFGDFGAVRIRRDDDLVDLLGPYRRVVAG